MTKQHFDFIAKQLRDSRPDVEGEPSLATHGRDSAWIQWQMTVETFALDLQKWNQRFDWERFLNACGYDIKTD